MGASDSKLVFKQGIFRLSQQRSIPPDDAYWTSFWELPESSEDVFNLFAAADIRRARDNALPNIETLILAVTSRLFNLRHHPSFPDPDIAPARDALNCVRVLTRLLPFLYESEALASWEEQFFWGTRRKRTRKSAIANEILFDDAADPGEAPRDPEPEFEAARPLAEELIDTLIDLLFFSDLTVPKQPTDKPRVSYAIWQSGVGCNTTVATTKEFESNRCEILRLLLTLTSQSMYLFPHVLPQRGVRALTYICTCADKQVVLSVLCSLLNTTLKYNPASWRVPYNALVFKDPKQILITYTLQFLLVVLVYPIPESNDEPTPKNYYRHFLGRLHRAQDFQFIVDGMTRILNQPLQQANATYMPVTQSSVRFAPEIIMLFWEITQCNKRFRSFIIDTERAHDFVILILFYAQECKNDASKQGTVRMCAFLLQTLSVEKSFGVNLNKPFESQETLPPAIRIQGFRGTFADFLLQSIYNLITTSQGKLTAIYPALLAVINNITPYLEGLSPATSTKLMQFFNSMSAPSFLLANDTNHDLLRSLLESINSIIEHRYKENPEFIYAVLQNRKRFEALRSFTLESGREEIERRTHRRKESSGSQVDSLDYVSTRSSVESHHSASASHSQAPSLGNVPEDSAFTIGDDDDDDDDDDGEDNNNNNKDDDDQDANAMMRSPSGSHTVPGQRSQSSRSPSIAESVESVEDAVPAQTRGMSEKARGKMPAGSHSFSRNNSTTSLGGSRSVASLVQPGGFEPTAQWIDSWLPELPLHTILSLIQQLTAIIPRQALTGSLPSREVLARIQNVRLVGVDPAPARVHSFEWTQLALGWYESLIWAFVFSAELQIAKGTVGIWNGTQIRLFRVQETAPEGPTLTSPRGAVDAVGSNIVNRIGQMNLRGQGSQQQQQQQPQQQTQQQLGPGQTQQG